MTKNIYIIIAIFFILSACKKPTTAVNQEKDKVAKWVDSLYAKMTIEEKVGQLFMIDVYSNKDETYTDSIKRVIAKYQIGGLIFFQGGPVRQAQLTNIFQQESKTPLLIGIDAEWGLNMRLDSTSGFPYNMTLGAIKDNFIIEQIGKQIGKDCKRLGIHLNFAPVADINTNPRNPIIGVRSYGEDKNNVADKAIAFTKGMQSEGVMACAKHFPGHGDTSTDSHKTLPTITFSEKRIDSVELYPFKQLFQNNIASVMVAHLNVPSLEKEKGLPSSLSHSIVTKLLKNKLGFKGLILTDALNMKGASNYKDPGDIDLAAFKAGNDMLLYTGDIVKGTSKIIKAYENKEITEERLSYSVKKILKAKYNAGLHNYHSIKLENLVEELNTVTSKKINDDALRSAITLVHDKKQTLPLQENMKLAYIKLGDADNTPFLTSLQSKAQITDLSSLPLIEKINKIKQFDAVIISYHKTTGRELYKLTEQEINEIQAISQSNKTIFSVFTQPYILASLNNSENVLSLIVAFQNSEFIQNTTVAILFGEEEAKGQLPVSIYTKE